MFFLLNWHYPKRFFHGACFGHTLDMGRFASVSFQRLGELGVFAGPPSDKMLSVGKNVKNWLRFYMLDFGMKGRA